MKFLISQLLAILKQRDLQKNLDALYRLLALLLVVIIAYSVAFHVLMNLEGQAHSWVTGLYWTLTVMTTLGFGDITFHSDAGRVFTIVVMLTGVMMMLIVLPFTFIRNFYAPWLEAQLKVKAPRKVPDDLEGHVIICEYDAIAQALISRLAVRQIPYFVLEPDPAKAVALHSDGVSVMVGYPDSVETWRNARAEHARLVVANLSDPANTNVTITVREHAPDTVITAIVEDLDALDVLRLAGATHVIALKSRLGQQLAARVNAGQLAAHAIGRYEDLIIAEFPARGTALAGLTVRESRLRERCGVNVVACWERGQIRPALPEATLGDATVAVVVGTEAQITALNQLLGDRRTEKDTVIVIGGGNVGRATIRALRERGVRVAVIDQSPLLGHKFEGLADSVIIGDAASLEVMNSADIANAASVVLTTHDDAVNIFLAVYSNRLNPECQIISRVTHERNIESIHRAGAAFVLSQSGLAAKLMVSVLQNHELIVIGETVELFVVEVPPALAGTTLRDSEIGSRTGMNVIAIRRGEETESSPPASAVLTAGASLVLFGTVEQRQELTRMLEER